jgi:hypothetical protein
MIIPTRTDDTITGIIRADFTKKIEETGYNHRDINNVSSIFLVKTTVMNPVIVSSVLVGMVIVTLIMFPLFS